LKVNQPKSQKENNQELNWSDLYGLGKGIWDGEDAQEYVNKHRADREEENTHNKRQQ
jgi:hypothetical protein